ncbi:olfactory receptor 10A4-like [Alligator sinensis]|uniref:Olfactory receptor n=1 Tax=Alligator sinensis TaxID=38654 RepID=A0A1U8DK28_ALLSI|nr:olfactory receptor 10A4-like [Alligator sinensis]
MTLSGNILIIALVATDQHLHTPMYFFLGNLSCLETFYTSTILPRVLASIMTGDRTISDRCCITQLYFFAFLAATECCLLAMMSYDRYLAICKPLHYTIHMNGMFCIQLAAGSWVSGFLASTITNILMSKLTFCSPKEIDHFFCDFPLIIHLSCSDTHLLELMVYIFAAIFTLPPFLLTLLSYAYIIATILRTPSAMGRHKAFSTCSSHLIVVTLFYGTIMLVYLLPKTVMFRDLSKIFSVFYSVLTPLVKPIIYSLRNKQVKEALKKVIHKFMTVQGYWISFPLRFILKRN